MDDVAARIRLRMHHLKIETGSELARRTHTPQQSVSRYLAGQTIPVSFLVACEEAGIARAGWLLTGEGAPDLAETEAQEIVERIRALVAPRSLADGDLLAEAVGADEDPGPDAGKRRRGGG